MKPLLKPKLNRKLPTRKRRKMMPPKLLMLPRLLKMLNSRNKRQRPRKRKIKRIPKKLRRKKRMI